MTWAEIWAFLDQYNQYPADFRQYVEGAYDIAKILPGTLADLSKYIQADYQNYARAPRPYQDPVTGQWWIDEPQYNSAGKQIGVKTREYTLPEQEEPPWQATDWIKDDKGNVIGYYDQKGVPQALDKLLQPQPIEAEPGPMPSATSDQPYILVNGTWQRNPDYISPTEQEASRVALDRADRDRFMAAQQASAELKQRQQELIWNRAAQAQQNIFQPQQPTYVNAESTEPVNWINYWKAGQDIAKKQVAAEQRGGAAGWAQTNMASSPWMQQQAAQSYTSPTGGLFAGYREELGPQGTNVPLTSSTASPAMWDPFTQTYRPETQQEWVNRLSEQGVQAGAFTPQMAQQASMEQYYNLANPNPVYYAGAAMTEGGGGLTPQEQATYDRWRAGQQQYVTEQQALWRQPNFPTGPETPQWARGVLQSPGQNINLQTLGQPGNMVRPVSAQMYSGWAPSQQQGYQGLASAQKGAYWPDLQANIETMWGASRPGQQARRRPSASWAY